MTPTVGVLALQGDFAAHLQTLAAVGARGVEVRTPAEVAACDALILPGGESTAIGKLMARYGLAEAIRTAHAAGVPLFGTCAGMILLARRIVRGEERGGQPLLGLCDIAVERNAFGRQVDSFETDLEIPALVTGPPVRALFIRAPVVAEAGPGVEVLATFENRIVLVRQGNVLAAAFHPELTGETRIHAAFVAMAAARAGNAA